MMLYFDATISLGNIIATASFLFMAGIAWTELRWRLKNLEDWRREHVLDADLRDEMIRKMDKTLEHVTFLVEESRRIRRGPANA